MKSNESLLVGMVFLGIMGVFGCAQPSSARCADGTICPVGFQCREGTCTPEKCGNGTVDIGEVCDDGNNISGDGCSSECNSDERCGNAFYDPGEECDCGDSSTDEPLPAGCSGRNDDSSGLCTSECKLHCGDGVINDEEECDGAPPQGLYCVDFGYDTGLLECSDFCTVVGGSGCVFFGWQRLPSITRVNLRSIWGTGATNLYAVGWAGTLVHFDGKLWQDVLEERFEEERLFTVWGRSADDIYVAGDNGLLLHYDGVEWSEESRLKLPTDPAELSTDINALWGSSDSPKLVAVGDSGRIWTFDGTTQRLEFTWAPNGIPVDLHALWGTSFDNLYAVGDDFTLLHYDGSDWSEVDTNLPTPQLGDDVTDDFNAVWGAHENDVYVVGDQGTVWHYDGEQWSHAVLPSSYEDAVLRAVWGTTSDNVFIVGEDGLTLYFDGSHWVGLRATISDHLYAMWGTSSQELIVVGNNGAIARHTGRGWAEIGPLTDVNDSPVQDDLTAVWGTSAIDIYAIGRNGVILHYDGTNWLPLQPKGTDGRPLGVTQHLRSIWGTQSGEQIFIVGDNGTILHFDQGVWRDSTIDAMGWDDFDGVWASAPDDVYAVGQSGSIYHFNGSDWSPVSGIPMKVDLKSIWGSSPTDIYAVTDTDLDRGVSSEILHFDGANWNIESFAGDEELHSVWGRGPEEVYASGGDGLLLRRSGSGDWDTVDPPTAQDLHGVWGNSRGELFAVGSNGAMVYYDDPNWQPVRTATFERLNTVWGADEVSVLVGREGVLEMLVRTDR